MCSQYIDCTALGPDAGSSWVKAMASLVLDNYRFPLELLGKAGRAK